MNPPILIPPVIALAIGGLWIGSQRETISTLEVEIARLTEHIRIASSDAADAEQAAAVPDSKTTSSGKPVDWEKTAASMANMRDGGVRDMRAMMRLQQHLMELDAEGLIAALDEIRNLDLPDEARPMLEGMLVGSLAEKDPQLALTRFADRLNDSNGPAHWQLSQSFGNWAEKDTAAATAWLDAKINEGVFDAKSLDGKSQARIGFESALVRQLMAAGLAGARLATLPESQRSAVIQQQTNRPLEPEVQATFAKLARENLAGDELRSVLADASVRLVNGSDDFSKVESYMDRIQATPEERKTCAEKAAKHSIESTAYHKPVTRGQVDSMRTWLSGRSPESTDRITGETLGNAMQGDANSYEDMETLMLQYHDESGGSDELIEGFLESWAVRNQKEQARALAEKISDPGKRAEFLEKLK